PRDADQRAIKRAYRRLAREYHPDLNPEDDEAEERFKRVLAAFHVLSDPETRDLYDDYGFRGLQADFEPSRAEKERARRERKRERTRADEEVFSDIFDGRSPLDASHMRDFGGFETSLERGRDLKADVTIDLVTAVAGGSIEVRLPDRRVEVTVPESVVDGDTVTYDSLGAEPVTDTGIPGDLHVTFRVEDHPQLRRDGLDLSLDVPVTVAEAVNGATITVPTPRGDMQVDVPAGVHTGTRLRLAGQGLHRDDDKGDLYVVIQVHTPDYVDDDIARAADELDRGYSEPVRRDLEL
ncbi:MAG: DnaJ C-terminal domain-containing protein, partial [Persicimonas sp.]